MRLRSLFILVAGLLVAASILIGWQLTSPARVSDANVETFERANQSYQNGNYAAAANMYEQLVTSGIENADLFYNLGVTYAAMGNVERSEEMFAAARAFAPREPQIAQTSATRLPLTGNETALLVLAVAGIGALIVILLRPRVLFKNGASV